MRNVPVRVLYREFLRRLFDAETFSAHAHRDAGILLGHLVTLLTYLSLLFALPALAFLSSDAKVSPSLFLLNTWSAQHFLIATTMVIVGGFAVLNGSRIFPQKRDTPVLAPLPVGIGLILVVLVLHIPAGVVWPFLFNRKMPVQSIPAYTTDRALPPVGAADLPFVLDRDIAPMLRNGVLAPGTGGGVAIGVYKGGVRRVMAYGIASPNSLFEIGSISKTFTGLLLAKMAAEKKVALEEPVRFLLPPNTIREPVGDEIRLLDLVTHHSGLPAMPGNFPLGDLAQGDRNYHAPDLYAYLAHHGVLRRKDASFTYSNLGFGILSQALANRAGVSYPELLRQEVIAPLGLRDTAIRLSPEQQARLIPGHNEKHEAVPAWNLDAFAGAGGLRSTAGDLLTYLEAHLHPDRPAPADLALAAALGESHKLRAAADPGARIALAWFYNPDTGTYFHSGVTGGYTSYAFFHPGGEYAGVVLLNSGPSFSNDCVSLGEHVRQRLAGEPALSLATFSIPARGGFGDLIRSFLAYWITMFLAGTFIFCCVLGLQGLAAQLPRRPFPRVFLFLQLAVVCAFIGVYFLQPSAGPPSLIRAQGDGLLSWSPSFWFLGLYQQLSGSPALALLAQRAWAGLVVAICAAGLACTLFYFRSSRQMVEEPAIFPSSRSVRFLLASYAGMAFAVGSFLLRSPAARELFEVSVVDPRHQVSTPLLASTALTMAFAVIGLRVAFSLLIDLGANGISRVTPGLLWACAVIPVWAGSAALLLSVWPRQAALSHLAILGLWGTALVELCLPGYRTIPFIRFSLPGRSNLYITLIVCASLFLLLTVVEASGLERKALQNPTYTGIAILLLASVAALARWRNWRISIEEARRADAFSSGDESTATGRDVRV